MEGNQQKRVMKNYRESDQHQFAVICDCRRCMEESHKWNEFSSVFDLIPTLFVRFLLLLTTKLHFQFLTPSPFESKPTRYQISSLFMARLHREAFLFIKEIIDNLFCVNFIKQHFLLFVAFDHLDLENRRKS